MRLHDVDEQALRRGQFQGLRMTAAEFLELPDDGCRYELVDGVVVLSPSPKPPHQAAAGEVFRQIENFLAGRRSLGRALFEIDVHLGAAGKGRDLVYSPEVIFVSADRLRTMTSKITGAPELVVEVVSCGSRKRDTITKRADYEKYGVLEYWIIDPARETFTFLRLVDGKFAECQPRGDAFESSAVPGFVLDLRPLRETFKPW